MSRLSIRAHLLKIALCVTAFVPASAHAEWCEASSDHFLIYADSSEDNIRRFSDQLERFHAALEVATGTPPRVPSPANRVQIFAVNDVRQVQMLYSKRYGGVLGFYIPRAGDSVAFVVEDEKARKDNRISSSMVTLLHEYAHHFTQTASAFPWPRWMGEGSAEFFSAARFEPDGSVSLGRPTATRSYELEFISDVPVKQLLDWRLYEKGAGARPKYNNFYARSWLLYHMLTFDPARKGQLAKYQRGLLEGKEPLEAGSSAFGDLDKLNLDLFAYAKRKELTGMLIPARQLSPGPIKVRALSPGEADAMSLEMRARRGVREHFTGRIASSARKIATANPKNARLQALLAETEYLDGNDSAAIEAADAAIALDPAETRAYVQKGLALFRQAEALKGAERAKAMSAARKPFLALNRIENDHPIPLIYFYRTFLEAGDPIPDAARAGLQRAAQLAPFDLGLHLELAKMYVRDNELDAARTELQIITANPHGGAYQKAAMAMRAALDAGSLQGGSNDFAAYRVGEDDQDED
jgi:hypothetical protein